MPMTTATVPSARSRPALLERDIALPAVRPKGASERHGGFDEPDQRRARGAKHARRRGAQSVRRPVGGTHPMVVIPYTLGAGRQARPRKLLRKATLPEVALLLLVALRENATVSLRCAGVSHHALHGDVTIP